VEQTLAAAASVPAMTNTSTTTLAGVDRTVDAIEPAEPEAVVTLRASVTTGYRCAYLPR
jgi:hypothetical protein